jgi:hypothetical protein
MAAAAAATQEVGNVVAAAAMDVDEVIDVEAEIVAVDPARIHGRFPMLSLADMEYLMELQGMFQPGVATIPNVMQDALGALVAAGAVANNDAGNARRFQRDQFWIRYLVCSNRVNDLVTFLTEMQLDFNNDYVAAFLNYGHPDFDNQTVGDMIRTWVTVAGVEDTMVGFGVEFAENFVEEEEGGNAVLTNPFALLLDMGQVFVDDDGQVMVLRRPTDN